MIDSHCHIYGHKYDEDRDRVVVRAVEAGVQQLLVVGCDVEDSKQALAFAEQTPGVFASVGIHPHNADTYSEVAHEQLIAMTKNAKVLAVGEMGLDYFYDNSPREIQKRTFGAQLELANQVNLPVVIHTRDAEDDSWSIISNNPPRCGGHVHCFTNGLEFAEKLLSLDLHIGFTGIVSFPSADDLREVVRMVPMNRLLIETDSPYLAPVPYRGRRNEPAYVRWVADAIAQVKQLDIAEVLEATTANYFRLYGSDPQQLLRSPQSMIGES